MKNKLRLSIFIFVAFNFAAVSQIKKAAFKPDKRPDLYLYFKDQENGMFRTSVGDQDYFWYRRGKNKDGRDTLFSFGVIDHRIPPIYKSQLFFNAKVEKIEKAERIKNFYEYSWEKKFPFKRVFIVERVAPDRYKVVEVTTNMSSDYF